MFINLILLNIYLIMVKLDIYQKAFVIILIIISIIRIFYGKHRLTTQYKKSFHPILERINSYLVGFGMIYFPLLDIYFSLFNTFKFEVPNFIKIISTIILSLDAIIFYLSHKELADNWSPFVEIKEKQKLIKTGIYQYIRHPMYLSMWIFAFFEGLVLSNYFIEIFGIITWGNLYFFRISNEEKIMIDTFGKEYEEYIENTGRILPKFIVKK